MKKKNNSKQHGLRLSVISFILCFFIVLSVTACSDNKISSEETKSGESVSPSAQTDVGSAVKLRETEILDNFYGLLNDYKDCLVNKSSNADLFSRYFHQEGTSLFASMAEYEARRAAFEGENIRSFAYSIEEYNMDHSDKSVHLTAMLDYETVYAGLLPDMTYVW